MTQTGRIVYSPVALDISAITKEIIEIYKPVYKYKSIEVIENIPESSIVMADMDMISTVIRNLISNAIKFTYAGGKILVVVTQTKSEIIVAISDNGIGIPSDTIGKLFHISSKYSTSGTSNEQGTGLGLILCKEFIDKHEGKIWVESQKGKGSTFSFSLPLSM